MDTSSSAHGTAAAASSSSSRRSNRWMYEVFLSFRGDDTRNTFTDHLSITLRNAGINTELDRKIDRSRIAVVVFSKRYPDFRWCLRLRELSKIMRCREDQEGIIGYPIFYDVDPSNVRKQSGDSDEVEQWRKDLKASSDLGGQNLKTSADGHEGLSIEKIVGDVGELLKTSRVLK
ncbi:TMV resistance protein N-like [Pyrus ussuriensis x Pyrus communis]|uniref:ADP-ribosyl cyclase/cyclic ADP-ribose hydrolase n=1 Tax=Pyrus ussuriensis x Pyrus communis TaxID=2448454 RepID=A0A5N5GFW1_9ROSA|nr:TMV resistance protein N-like [Pyrus ussuriensis x Pyrus communis]